MISQPDLLSAFVQASYQKLNIADLFTDSSALYGQLSEGMPQFKWEVTANERTGSVHISAMLGNVKESWTITLSLTKGRSVQRTIDTPTPRAFYTDGTKPLGPLDPDPRK